MSNLVASTYIYKIMTSLFFLVTGGMASSEDDEAHPVPSYMLPQGTRLDRLQKKILKERLRDICSEIPIYVCVLKKTNISGHSQALVSYVFFCVCLFPD
jgi:hypothetical protein